MDNEEYKKQIIEMINNINSKSFLRRIYLIITVLIGG